MPRVRFNRVPLRRRDGSIAGHALLDPEDYARFRDQRWSLQATGYVQGWDDGHVRTLHRMVLGLPVGDVRHVDHVNGDKLDNRRANLRAGHQALNKRHFTAPKSNNSTGVPYVHRSGRRFEVRCGGVCHGRFDTPEEAADIAAQVKEDRDAEVSAAYAKETA